MGIFNFVKAGGKKFGSIVGTGAKVNKSKLDQAKTDLAIGKQKLKGSTAKLDQTRFEIVNKLPITFGGNKKKTLSNTEKAKLRNDASKKAFKASEGKTKHFYAPKNFNKGGRVGLKSGTNLGMQSVKYGLDNNPNITAADPKAKFIAKNKKNMKKVAKAPIANSVKKGKA